MHTLYKIDAEREKGDVMGAMDGNLELFIKKESATSAQPRHQKGGVFESLFQPLHTSKSPSPINRTDRPPFVELSNTLDSPICTSLPPKPSRTRINRFSSEPEETLKVFIGKKRASQSKKNRQGVSKKKKLVSQTDRENAITLVEASSQSRQDQ